MPEVDIEKVTLQAEAGDGDAIKKTLDEMGSLEDRIRFLRKMDELNEKHRKANPAIPDLDINITFDRGGISLQVAHDPPGWLNAKEIYSETLFRSLSRQVHSTKR
jgi:hypothetical protein